MSAETGVGRDLPSLQVSDVKIGGVHDRSAPQVYFFWPVTTRPPGQLRWMMSPIRYWNLNGVILISSEMGGLEQVDTGV